MKMSLCVLARGNPEQTAKLIDSVRGFDDLNLEVVIGDNSPNEDDKLAYQGLAHAYTSVSDELLWEQGFGPAKQKVVDAASSDWVLVADVGEVWHENKITAIGLVREIELCPKIPVFRVLRGPDKDVRKVVSGELPHQYLLNDDNGRIFDRRQMAMYGMIHEAPFHKEKGIIWAHWARMMEPLVFVEHGTGQPPTDTYETRKQVLYDHLVYTIVHQPERREGTDRYWWTKHWTDVVEPRYREISFDEWQSMPG
jgi:hypothetical protein